MKRPTITQVNEYMSKYSFTSLLRNSFHWFNQWMADNPEQAVGYNILNGTCVSSEDYNYYDNEGDFGDGFGKLVSPSTATEVKRDVNSAIKCLLNQHCKILVPYIRENPFKVVNGVETTYRTLMYRGTSYGPCYACIGVLSTSDEYTVLDRNTYMIVFEYEDEKQIRRFSSILVNRLDIDFWVCELILILSHSGDPESVKAALEKQLQYGWVWNANLVRGLSRFVKSSNRDSFIRDLNLVRSYDMDHKESSALLMFINRKLDRAQNGVWKFFRLKGDRTRLKITNGHATFIVNDEGQLPSYTDYRFVDEEGMLDHLIPRLEEAYAQLYLSINGVTVPLDYRNYRYYIFDIRVNKDEFKPILSQLTCMNTSSEMIDFIKECSRISLFYRNVLSEGIRCNATIKRSFPSEMEANAVGRVYDIYKTYSDGRVLVRIDTPVLLKFVKNKNNRGISLSVGKITRSIDPRRICNDEQCRKRDKTCDSAQLHKILASIGLSDKDITYVLIKSHLKAMEAFKRSEKLLAYIVEEVGAKKETMMLDGDRRHQTYYTVTGHSGNEYAVRDDNDKFRVYRKIDDVWRFVCIVGSSASSQEVGKDGLVTRLLALINDTDNAQDICTLGLKTSS